MCESSSDLGLLIQQHYLRGFIDVITGLPFSVFSRGVHTPAQSSRLCFALIVCTRNLECAQCAKWDLNPL